MAVVSGYPKETSAQRGTGITETQRRYVRTFVVRVDSPTDTVETVRDATGVPRPRDAHPTDATAWVRDVDVRQNEDNKLLYDVTVSYETPPPGGFGGTDGTPSDPNPLARPADISYTFRVERKPLEIAGYLGYRTQYQDGHYDDSQLIPVTTDRPVLTSSNTPYVPAHEVDVGYQVMTVSKNFPSYSAMQSAQRFGRINSDMFFGMPPWTVKIDNISAVRNVETYRTPPPNPVDTTVVYWTVTFEFSINPDGWTVDLKDMSPVETLTDPGDPTKLLTQSITDDIDGVQLQTPTLLDGQGRKLVLTNYSNPALNKRAVYRRWQPYFGLAFSTLGLT